MIYILAPHYRWATERAREADLKIREWRYVRSVHQLYGLRDPIVWKCGPWYEGKSHAEFMDINDYLVVCNATVEFKE